MLQIDNICKAFGKAKIVDNVSFSLEKGEVLGLLGPNGAGKTTLMNILALVSKPDRGRYLLDTTDALVNTRALRPSIGFVPQDIALFEDLTVRDNLLCWSRLPAQKAKEKAEDIACALRLDEIFRKKIKNLSGGMKRRVNLAVALLNNPTLLVMDEPLVGVDIEHTACIINYLRSLSQQGVTQIISGHSVSQLLPLTDKLMVMRNGQVLFFGDRAAFMQYAPGGDAEAAVLRLLYQGEAI